MLGFKRFTTAWRTVRGIEIMHVLRKGQARWMAKGDVVGQTRLIHKVFGLAVSRGPPNGLSRVIPNVATEPARVSNEACNVYIQLTAERRRQYTTVRLHSALGSLIRSWITNWEQVSRPGRSARRSARRESPRTGRRVRRAFRPHPARTAPERVRPGRRRPGHTPSDPSFPDGTAGR